MGLRIDYAVSQAQAVFQQLYFWVILGLGAAAYHMEWFMALSGIIIVQIAMLTFGVFTLVKMASEVGSPPDVIVGDLLKRCPALLLKATALGMVVPPLLGVMHPALVIAALMANYAGLVAVPIWVAGAILEAEARQAATAKEADDEAAKEAAMEDKA